jgi:glycosyltransferase involved in cell wall biosynthesis
MNQIAMSVVLITRNEAARLRLVLESFAGQKLALSDAGPDVSLEMVVVNDGSDDETDEVLAEFTDRVQMKIVRHRESHGRSPSRNDGVRAASGDVVILFDGDCMASPHLVALHAATHARRTGIMGRGETYHIRSTRFFLDPERGLPRPGEEEHVRRMGDQLRAALVTREQVRDHFDALAARGEPGIYAGAGPRRLYELELRALHEIPASDILWMTAPGQNFSIRRADFTAVGGFDERLTLNEHRELAFRLYQRGVKMVPVEGARSFHLLHRVGWRDPLVDADWERLFYEKHPCPATKLMSIFWLSLTKDKDLPEEGRISSLEQLDQVLRQGSTFDYDSLRRTHPKLVNLGEAMDPSGGQGGDRMARSPKHESMAS